MARARLARCPHLRRGPSSAQLGDQIRMKKLQNLRFSTFTKKWYYGLDFCRFPKRVERRGCKRNRFVFSLRICHISKPQGPLVQSENETGDGMSRYPPDRAVDRPATLSIYVANSPNTSSCLFVLFSPDCSPVLLCFGIQSLIKDEG